RVDLARVRATDVNSRSRPFSPNGMVLPESFERSADTPRPTPACPAAHPDNGTDCLAGANTIYLFSEKVILSGYLLLYTVMVALLHQFNAGKTSSEQMALSEDLLEKHA